MRTITDHIVNPCNDSIHIGVLDEPGAGGANHVYDVGVMTDAPLPKDDPACTRRRVRHDHSLVIHFQNGPISEKGVNGLTQEALLAIVIDRLRCFQAGPYACRDNAIALTHCEEALFRLHNRTRERMARSVEGTHTP